MKCAPSRFTTLLCLSAALGISCHSIAVGPLTNSAQPELLQRLFQAKEWQQKGTESLLPLERDLVFLADFERDDVVFLGNTGVYPVPFDKGHYRPGKFGRGFYFEMPQSNLLPPDIADVETNLSGFQPAGGATLACVATNTAFGRQALLASLPGVDAGFQTIPVNVAWHANCAWFEKKWTLLASCYVKGPKDGKVKIDVTFVPQELKLTSTNDPVRIADTNTPQEIILTGDWQRIACIAEGDSRLKDRQAVFSIKSATNMPLTLLVDGFQCEQAAYYPYGNLMPATWTPGGQSVPATSVSIGSPLREMFPASEGTIAFWTITPRESNLPNPGSIFWLSFGAGWGPGWAMSTYRFDTPGGGNYSGNALGKTMDANHWHHLAMSWGLTNASMYKDGQLVGTFARTNLDVTMQVETFAFILGGSYSDSSIASSIMDDVAIFKRKLTDAETGTLATGQVLHATANTILFSRGARSVYYRDEDDAALELTVASLETTAFPLNVDCSIGELIFSSQALTVKPGITTVRFRFSPSRLKCGVYTCKVGALAGNKAAYAEFPIDVVPALRRDHFMLSSWGCGGETATWRDFCKTIGLNTIDTYAENVEQLGKNGFLYNWHYNFGNGVWNAQNRETVRNGTRKEAGWRAVYPNWRSTLLNSEFISGSIPDAENRQAWFDAWAEKELGFPVSTNGWQLGTSYNPTSGWFAENAKPGTNGIYKASRAFEFLDWWYNRGCGWWRMNAEAADVIRAIRPDVKCWTDPLWYPGQIADLDAGSTWSYQLTSEPLIGEFESSYACARDSDKEYYATLGMDYVNGLVQHVRLPDGTTNNLAPTADDLIQQAWIVVTHIPTDGLTFWLLEGWFYGQQRTNGWYVAPGSDAKLGAVLKNDLLPIGTMLKHLPNAQRPVALLLPEGTQWMCAGEGGWGWGMVHYPNYWKQWVGAMGIPYDIVLDHNVTPGALSKYKAIIFPMAEFVSEKVYNELLAAGKAGVQIVVDSYCRQEYPNMVRLNQEYFWRVSDKQKYAAEEQATLKFLTELKDRLLPQLDAYAVGAEGKVITNIREADGVKYVSVINDNRQEGPYSQWTTNTFKPYGKAQKAKVFLRIPAGSAVYEFTQSRRLPVEQEGDHWVTTVDLPPHAGRLLCLYPAPITRITIDAGRSYAAGTPGVITATILDARKQTVPGRQLLQVEIADPDGNRHDESGLYRTVNGKATIPFRPAMNEHAGQWRLTITERTSGISQLTIIQVDRFADNEEKRGIAMRREKLAVMVACVTGSAVGIGNAMAGEAPAPYTVETMCGIVQPMKHDMKGRLPILLWDQPLPLNEEVVKWREDGRLRKAIDQLAQRGIAVMPMILTDTATPAVTGNLGNAAAVMAIVQTLKDAGQPVHVLNAVGFCQILRDGKWVRTLYANAPTYKGRSPWNAKGDVDGTGETEWVAMTRYDAKPTVEMYEHWMQLFKDAGIELDGLWTDHEGFPGPWNFAYEGAKSEAGRQYYPAEALTSFPTFQSYIVDLRTKILSEAIADPVHAAFPKALVGNYDEIVSSAAYPKTDGNLAPNAPSGIGRLNVMMPSLYANTIMLKRFFNIDWAVTQADVDNIYFTILLQQASAACANKQPGQLIMPFVANYVVDDPNPRYRFGLSSDLYRELHRHALLRGTDGFYVFTTHGYYGQTPTDIFAMVENTRAPYDEMLEYREFLDHGTPMNFEVPAIRTKGLIWSGLRLKNRCLVRAFTMGPTVRRLDFVPFPGVAVSVDAPPEGATYLIDKRGRAKKVGAGL